MEQLSSKLTSLTVRLFDSQTAESMGKVLDDLERQDLEALPQRSPTDDSHWASTMWFQRKAFDVVT
jgi:hypothetical protein